MNAGHQHPKIVRAIQEQAATLCYAHPGFATEPRGLLGKKISEVAPGDLNKTFFCLGGAEANENAIKIARAFTGRFKILSRYRSYHGATHGAIALTGDYRRLPVEPAMPGVVHFLDPFCYRCPFGWTRETCHRECISHVEEVLQYEGPNTVAAIIMEGVTGSNGLIVPPDDYWPRIREICDKYGILLISDEVMSGWGRTGKWFAVDNWNVVPDIITTAKGITSGYVPLGAVIVTDKIADYYEDKYMYCGLTYSGHPLSCAAGVAAIEALEEDGMIENSAEVGKFLGKRLEEIKQANPCVGDVRYIGLFSTIELVKNRETKQAMPASVMGEIGKYLRDNGLFTFILSNANISCLFVVPPLCITKEQLEEGLGIVAKALQIGNSAAQ
jgi:taurine--2-oxoglutarate transaminase